MKREFKAHPLMVLSLIKPFLFVLLLPVARGLLQYVQDRHITPILRVEIVLFLIIIIAGFLRWRAFRLCCDQNTVTVRDGVFFVREAVIPISGISSVQSEQTPLDYLFHSVTFFINTEAGNSKSTDYKFKLSRNDSHEVSDLLYGKEKGERVRFSPVKIAILAAATSSAFTGLLVAVPIISNSARLLGVGINEVLDQINAVSHKFQTYFPPIVNTVSLVLLASLIISFIYSFLKYVNFRLYLNSDRIEVRSGLFVVSRTSFKKKSVNNVKIEQTILMKLIRRYAMKVNVGGFGEAKSESQILVPSGKYREIKGMFSDYFPFLTPCGRLFKSHRGALHENRYLFWAELFFLGLIAAALYFGYTFTEFGSFIVFLTLVLGFVIFYYAFLCHQEYKSCCVRLGSTVFARGKKWLRSCRLYCPKDKVGEIKLVRYPPDSIFKTCNIKIIIRSEMNESLTIRHLDYETLRQEIFNCYGINE